MLQKTVEFAPLSATRDQIDEQRSYQEGYDGCTEHIGRIGSALDHVFKCKRGESRANRCAS